MLAKMMLSGKLSDSKTEVKSQAKPSSLETSHDKKERELVDGWVAHRGTSGKAQELTWMLELRLRTTSGVPLDPIR